MSEILSRGQLFAASTALRLPELYALKALRAPDLTRASAARMSASADVRCVIFSQLSQVLYVDVSHLFHELYWIFRVHDELEALEAILLDGFKVKDEDGVPVVETVIHPSTGDQIDQQYVCITLEVVLTPDYPETSPEVILRNPRGLDDRLVSKIHTKIKEKLDGHVGNPIVFELIEVIYLFSF